MRRADDAGYIKVLDHLIKHPFLCFNAVLPALVKRPLIGPSAVGHL